ncbi:MAG: hypothetical protein HUK21_09890 [Fibrobacteraceae bacterium]|nr:hypothetical protein [Fibrobacteraceae bacterium]
MKKNQVMMALKPDVADAFNAFYEKFDEPKPSKTALLSFMVKEYIRIAKENEK